MPSEREVSAVAAVIAQSPLIDEPKLPPECWQGMARGLLEVAELIRLTEKKENCTHHNKRGTGTCSTDGMRWIMWHCQDCGASFPDPDNK